MKKHPLLSFLNFVLTPCGFIFPSLLILSILGQFIRPSSFVFFQWLGLFFPVLVGINLVLLLYWGLQRRKLFLLPLAALLLNSFSFLKILQFRWKSPSEESVVGVSDQTINVVSYNVRSFQMDYGGSSLENVADWVREKNVDVVCLQEVPCVMPKSILVDAFSFMPYMIVASKRTGELSVVVFSRFPVQSAVSVSFPERANCALISNLNINGKIIRLLTCHLQTTNWNQLKGENDVDRSFGRNMKHWLMSVSVINRNYLYRESQSDFLRKVIEGSSLPTIVCGDFNATPFSYTYRTMKGRLADSFQECGTGYTFSYRFLHQMLQIDYVFYSLHDFTALNYDSPDLQYSDHKPILVRLSLKN